MYSLRFRVRRYAVMCADCHYARRDVVLATKPVRRSQIRRIVHHYTTRTVHHHGYYKRLVMQGHVVLLITGIPRPPLVC